MEMIIVFIFYVFGQVTSFDFQDFDENYVLGIPYVTFSTQFSGNDGFRYAHDTRNNCMLHRKETDPSYMVHSLSKILQTANMKNPMNKEALQNCLMRAYRKTNSISRFHPSIQNPEREYSSRGISSKPIVKRQVVSRNRFFYNKDEFSKFFESFISLLSSLNPELLYSLREQLDSKFNTERNSVLIERKMGTLLAIKAESCSCPYKENTKSENREYSTLNSIESQSNSENCSNCRCKTTDSAISKQNSSAGIAVTSVTTNVQVQKQTTGDLNANVLSKIEKDTFKSELFRPWYTFRPFFGLGRIQGDIGSHFNKGFWSTESASTMSTELLATSETEVKTVLVGEDKSHSSSTEPVMSNSTFNNSLYKLSKDLLQKVLPNLSSDDCFDVLKSEKDSNRLVDQLLDKLFSIAIESAASTSSTAKDELDDYQLDMTMSPNRKSMYRPESYFKSFPTLIQRPIKGVKKLHNRGGILSGFILEAAKNHSDTQGHTEREEGSSPTTNQFEEDEGLLKNEYEQNDLFDGEQSEEENKAQIPFPRNTVKTKVLILNPYNENKSEQSFNDLKRLEETKKADLNEKLKMNSNLLHQSIEQIPLHIALMKNIHYSSKRPKRNKKLWLLKNKKK